MAGLQPVRGTRDLLPEDCRKFRHIVETARHTASLYGFEEIETPVFESSSVFLRTLGDTSDVVTKQTYTFQDRGGDEITLRPEGTAAIARAFISNGLAQQVPLKLFYAGPMFRYERPQKGRYRQFYQFGVELLGVEKPQADIEMIALASQVLKALKVSDIVTLELNTIGDLESRQNYRAALVEYLKDFRTELSADSQVRLDKNPLRILDSKDENDKKILEKAPMLSQHLNTTSQDFFQAVCEGLKTLEIPYQVSERLVRGLDYYTHTVFEFTTNELGAQNTVLAGGRYDGLIKSMGGPATPGVGWAAGTDRLSLLLREIPQAEPPIAIIPVGTEAEVEAIKLTQRLRAKGHVVDLGYGGNVGKRMKRADKIQAKKAVIMGTDELARQAVTVKDLKTGEQKEAPLDKIEDYL